MLSEPTAQDLAQRHYREALAAGWEIPPGARILEIACGQGGLAADYDEPELKYALDSPECVIRFEIRGSGRGRACFWTCDYTEDYIRINGSYRT